MTVTPDPATQLLHQAQIAFERGRYRDVIQTLDQALPLVDINSPLEGEIKTWLVTAYEAIGENQRARELCQELQKHPHRETRQQNRRLMGILSAPRLRRHQEWLTEIPDLSQVSDKREKTYARMTAATSAPKSDRSTLAPDRYSHVQPDLGFIWLVLGGLVLGLGVWAGWG